MKFWLLMLAILCTGCSNLEVKSLIPSANIDSESKVDAQTKKRERKIQNTRKSQILDGKYTNFVVLATYLNEVDNIVQPRDVFMIELYEKSPRKNIKDDLEFYLLSVGGNFEALFVTQLDEKDYTSILQPKNIYNKLFIIEFDKIPKSHRENMKLKMKIKDKGEMIFDFSYPVMQSKLR